MTAWRHRDTELRKILQDNDDEGNELKSVTNTKVKLILHLKIAPHFRDMSPSIISEMEEAATYHSFNKALDRVFDYADDNLIWIEF